MEGSHPSQLSSRVNKGDLEIIRELYATGRIRQDPNDGSIILPQVLIDGINVGDGVDLQALEDEGNLELILKREICPKCLKGRKGGSSCRMCKVNYSELMPGRQTIGERLATFADDEDYVQITGLEKFKL